MYVWLEELKAVLTIIRMGRGLMMGVDHNRNMEWVGASAGLWVEEYEPGEAEMPLRVVSRVAQARLHRSLRFAQDDNG